MSASSGAVNPHVSTPAGLVSDGARPCLGVGSPVMVT